jgi:ABC-2 type transport system ATP-binding protein
VTRGEGEVTVFGHNQARDPMAVKRQIGLVPQEFNFNQFEPVEEIVINQAGYYGIPARQARPRSEHYLRALGLWEKRKGMARQLSGGMKRRLMVARALIHEPRLLILDEPTAGVDIELRRSMWQFLREVNREQGTTIILTTHYLEEAENLCRHVAIIDQGEIIENTSIRALIGKLNKETLVLDLKHPLTTPPILAGYPCHLADAQTLEVEVRREQGLNPLFTTLNQAGLEIISMRNKANRLEELFLDLVEKREDRP